MQLRPAALQFFEHFVVVTSAELDVLGREDHDGGAIFFALAQAAAGLDDGVEERGAGPGHREHVGAGLEQLLIGGVVAEDRWSIRDADDRYRADAVEGLHERAERFPDLGDVSGGGLRVIYQDRHGHWRGCRRDAQHFPRHAVFANHEVFDAEVFDRGAAVLLERAGVHDAFV